MYTNIIRGAPPIYYYEPDEQLFTRQKLIRDGVLEKVPQYSYASYDVYGNLIEIKSKANGYLPKYNEAGIYNSCKTGKFYKDRVFKQVA